jgi:hypothetical protein
LRTDCRRIEERSGARHRELQQENQGIHESMAEIQSQLQQQEIWHNQELAIVLRGVNRNTRQIGVVTQRLGNPQQPAHSVGTDESRLPSTFHSAASNDQHVPIAPGFADRIWAEENQDRQFAEENPAEENPEAQLANQQEEPGQFHN